MVEFKWGMDVYVEKQKMIKAHTAGNELQNVIKFLSCLYSLKTIDV